MRDTRSGAISTDAGDPAPHVDTARQLYEAEVALHIAKQTHVDTWIAAATEKLDQAIVEHLAAIGEQYRAGSRRA